MNTPGGNNDYLAKDTKQDVSSATSGDDSLGVRRGIKFGFGFAIGVTFWFILLGILSTIFWGSLFAGMFRTMMPGGFRF